MTADGKGGDLMRLVVVGHGPAAHRLIEKLRNLGFGGAITVLGEEPRPAYDRVALTSYLGGKSAEDLTYPVPEDVTLRLGDRVVAVDREARLVRTASGHAEPYDVLVLATGSRPFVPPVPGHDLPGCHVYRTIEDLDAIREEALAAAEQGTGTGVVVGGGLLGLEAADALRGLGNALLSLDQPELALPQFEAALAVDANDPRVHNSLGVVHDMMGNHRMAQKHYRAGLAIAPDNLMLRNNLGLSLALSGDFQEAIDLLRPLAFHPAATPRNRQNLALVYGLSGDLDAAARIARIDLDAKAVESNLAYYGVLRELAERPRTSALGANPVRREVMGLGADTQIQ